MTQTYTLPDEFEPRTLESESGAIRYWVNGSVAPDDITLIFLPGLTADHTSFSPQLYCFVAECSCIVWDAPAHGESRPFPLTFSLEDCARYVDAIIEQEGVRHPVLVGHSFGGYIAQAYAQLFPGKLAGLVLVDSAPLQKSYYSSSDILALRHTKLMFKSFPWKGLVSMTCKGTAESEFGRACMRDMMEAFDKKEFCDLTAYGYRLVSAAIEADLPYQIDCPAVLVCGDRDQAGLCLKLNREWQRVTGLKLVWAARSGHLSTIDNPIAVNGAIDSFLDELFDAVPVQSKHSISESA